MGQSRSFSAKPNPGPQIEPTSVGFQIQILISMCLSQKVKMTTAINHFWPNWIWLQLTWMEMWNRKWSSTREMQLTAFRSMAVSRRSLVRLMWSRSLRSLYTTGDGDGSNGGGAVVVAILLCAFSQHFKVKRDSSRHSSVSCMGFLRLGSKPSDVWVHSKLMPALHRPEPCY